MNLLDLQGNYITSKDTDSVTISKLNECYRITEEIISSLDPLGLLELTSGDSKDIDTVLSNLLNETYGAIYGRSDHIDTLSEMGKFSSASVYYLDRLSESAEKTLKIESLPYFITSTLPNFDLGWHHLEWCEVIRCYQRYVVLAARNHGKSYMFSLANVLWRLYRYTKNSRRKELNILGKEGNIFSATVRQANRLLAEVKSTIKDTPELYDLLYPGSDGWADTKIDCKNGAKLRVYGMGASVRGGHPGWIVCDDLLDESSLYSQEQREKTITYFHSVIMNMIEPGGSTGVVGTPMHTSDLYGDLKTKKSWHLREYPSIFPDGKILWDNRFSFEDLMMKKESEGSLNFSRENLCRPMVSDSSIFPMSILQRSVFRMEMYTLTKNIESFPVKFVRKGAGCDFAISSSIGADSSVFIVGGIDENDTIWIVNMFRMTGKSYAEQMSMLKSIHLNFRPDLFVFETNGFQKIFADECRKENMPIIEHVTSTNKYDFKEGLPSLSVLFETGKIKIPIGDEYSKDMKDLLFTELSSITFTDKGLQGVGAHDDMVIALWKFIWGLKYRSISNFDFDYV